MESGPVRRTPTRLCGGEKSIANLDRLITSSLYPSSPRIEAYSYWDTDFTFPLLWYLNSLAFRLTNGEVNQLSCPIFQLINQFQLRVKRCHTGFNASVEFTYTSHKHLGKWTLWSNVFIHIGRENTLLEITACNAARVKEYIWPHWALRQTDEDYIEIVLLRK